MSARRARRAGGALAAAGALLGQSATAAADGPTAPGWAFGAPGGEVAVAAVSAASLATFLLPQRRTSWGADASRAPDAELDRISDFIGAGWGSLLVMSGAYAFEGGYLDRAGAADPYERALRASLIDVEAAALSTGLSTAIKRLSGRCRPRAWLGDRCRDGDEHADAFPSGHTTPVAAIAGARLSLALRSHGDAGLRVGALSLAEGAALVTMALRIGAGAHSWEDVGAGWILGHVTGMVLGYLHPMEAAPAAPAARGATPAPASVALSWSGRF